VIAGADVPSVVVPPVVVPPAPAITGATVINGFLVVAGPNGQLSTVGAVPLGTQVFFTDLNGDGNGDLVMVSAGGFFVFDGATARVLAVAFDADADGFNDVFIFSPTTSALQTVVVGRTGQVIPVG